MSPERTNIQKARVTESAVLPALRARREEVEKTQHAANVSLAWFEHMKRYWGMDPLQFAFGVMSRSKQITWENLELRDPAFVAAPGAAKLVAPLGHAIPLEFVLALRSRARRAPVVEGTALVLPREPRPMPDGGELSVSCGRDGEERVFAQYGPKVQLR